MIIKILPISEKKGWMQWEFQTENIRKYQTEVITELKSTLEGFNSTVDKIEKQISELREKAMENNKQNNKMKKRVKRSKNTFRGLYSDSDSERHSVMSDSWQPHEL